MSRKLYGDVTITVTPIGVMLSGLRDERDARHPAERLDEARESVFAAELSVGEHPAGELSQRAVDRVARQNGRGCHRNSP